AGNSLAAVAEDFGELLFPYRRENLSESHGGATGRIFFRAMMHFDHFQVEARTKDFRGLAGKPEERVDTGGIVGCDHHWDLRGAGENLFLLRLAVTGRANNHGL